MEHIHEWKSTDISTGVDADWLEVCECGAEKYTTVDQEGVWTETITESDAA